MQREIHPQIIDPTLIKDRGEEAQNENCAKDGASEDPMDG